MDAIAIDVAPVSFGLVVVVASQPDAPAERISKARIWMWRPMEWGRRGSGPFMQRDLDVLGLG
jgi:hypothetical protein